MRLHYVYPYPHVDEVMPLMASGRVLPYLDVPFQHAHPDVLKRMKRPASGERNLERIAALARACPELVVRSTFIAGFPGETEAEFEHLLEFIREAQHRPRRLLRLLAGGGRQPPTSCPARVPEAMRESSAARASWQAAESVSAERLQRRVGATMQVLVDHAPMLGRKGGTGRSYADAPEIDGTVRLLPPAKASTQIRVGEFVRARIVAAQGHDLVAEAL